ncbi:OLC1v1038264C1 [Oldenlandia corymbosa var. corymbosa]|uniref:OLC1v1038264C1 n=1 Tax=Oldenlandia corymbosa var. corymbosa TaxID=529605 RepID=A0AAV1D355_OLDCO|nr:OLC1v1038264C1 [Oldenlandia corymbosa var. corymbosa]
MQAYIWLGPTAAIDGGGGGGGTSASTTAFSLCAHRYSHSSCWPHFHHSSSRGVPSCSATAGGGGGVSGRKQNHYTVLGLASDASPTDIKKAYRLLALKYHPDVSKDAGAHETFKSIRLAYEILSNEATRNQYDRALRYQSDSAKHHPGSDWNYSPEYEDQLRIYRWAYVRQKMQRENYWQHNRSKNEKGYSFSVEEEQEESDDDEERGPFTEVLQSALLTLFLMHTVGIRLSLTFSSIMAFLDQKLDGGYKIGYLIAWILGGTGGIMLTLCLSFSSWVCGKTSSGIVALVVVSMWFVSNLARFVPLPQGALLTLLYMSIKLQLCEATQMINARKLKGVFLPY